MTLCLQARYLALLDIDCLPVNRLSLLIKTFGNLDSLYRANTESLQAAGLNLQQIDALRLAMTSKQVSSRVTRHLKWMQSAPSNHIVCFEEGQFPCLLATISHPPPLLFLSGDPITLNLPQLAIVGSRNASGAGKQIAFWIAKELAEAGFAINSGLAAGIDTQAHRGALSVAGFTTAVMGTGIDTIYPLSNRKLAENIQQSGALISEFSLGSPPVASHFPVRNRIISGMSLGVIVVEAALKSGSLVTARLAMEQNREVFAVPGSIFNPQAKGCHRLIRDGAKLVDSAESVVEELTGVLGFLKEKTEKPTPGVACLISDRSGIQLSSEESTILDDMGYDQISIDALSIRVNWDVQTISRVLSQLEIKGLIEQCSGQYRQLISGLQEPSD